MIDVGDTIPFAADVRDANSALANALTVTLTITLPDATTVTPTVANPPSSTGHYSYDYPTVQAGPHDARWFFTFTSGSTTSLTQHYDVRGTASRHIISLADAKDQLKLTTTDSDERLRGFIESATEVVERHTGMAVVRQTVVEDHRLNYSPTLTLKRCPVISVTSAIRVDGTASWSVADLYLSKSSGIVTVKGAGAYFSGHIEWIYVAGMITIPSNFVDAATMIVEHLWQTRRGAKGVPRTGGTDDTVTIPGFSFSIPRKALELLGSTSTMAR